VAACIALGIGFFAMLPDDYENLAESVIASNVFANNFLACITTKNYWDVSNAFKPLMHFWYVGVLMQAYVVLPVLFWGTYKLSHKHKLALPVAAAVLTAISAILYFLPVFSQAQKFYYLPFRLFEITLGCLVAFAPKQKLPRGCSVGASWLCTAVLVLLLCFGSRILPVAGMLTVTVVVTALFLLCTAETEECKCLGVRCFAGIGKISFSIYVSHQVLAAFLRYAVTDSESISVLLLYLAATAAVSTAAYFSAERPFGKLGKQGTKRLLIVTGALFLVSSLAAGLIYLNAGVVRDVPELGITKDSAHRGMHGQYCDIPYNWNKDFTDTDKVKVLVIGDSFGRDWANILNESAICDEIEISYVFPKRAADMEQYRQRVESADVIFRSISVSENDVTDYLPAWVPSEKLYFVGYKSFGSSNGMIYSHRNSPDYFAQTVTLDASVLADNEALAAQYGDHFVNMIAAVQNEDGGVRVFSDNGYLISQDCRHLTKYGAMYYSRILDLNWITEMK